tara:strand:- start:787 stop:1311 length:525 start_codon:yes stop_codon:yes gene_type:complete
MASKGINSVTIVGNLGDDPKVFQTANGQVTSISVATSESWIDKNTQQKQEKTEWHAISFMGKLAEIAGQYLKKGSQVYVSGKLQTRKYQDKNTGADKYSTSIIVDSFSGVLQMLGSKDQSSNGQATQQQPQPQQPPANFQPQMGQPQQFSQAPQGQGFNNDFDDDIPFNGVTMR